MDNDLRMLILDCPLKLMDDPFVRDLLAKLIKLKAEGFETVTSKYFAFDQSDLVATHFIVGRFNESGMFDPLISYKGMGEESYLDWGIDFSGISVVEATGSKDHIIAIENYVDKIKRCDKKIGYSASLAMCPLIRSRREKNLLLEMFLFMSSKFITDFGLNSSICIARVKKKSHRILQRIGYRPLKLFGQELPAVPFPQYINDEFLIMVLDEISEEGMRIVGQYSSQWDQRIIISENVNNLSHMYNVNLPDEHRTAS